jgi:phytoene synthase
MSTATLVARTATVAMAEPRRVAWRILRHHAKSFTWGARLLPRRYRRDAAAIYAWCRRCDDAVDDAPDPATAARAVAHLRSELDRIYAPDGDVDDPVLVGFRDVVGRRRLPRVHADELLDGMAMDVGRVRYQTFAELLVYCHRVAGVVGLMMARVMGVTDERVLARAADLGIAMQLTNICRDVAEDARLDRVYLPAELLGAGEAAAVAELLRRADGYYRSGDAGLVALPAGCAAAIRAARLIYADIGRVIAAAGFDVHAGRARVSSPRKLWLALRALLETAAGRVARRRGSP